MSPNRLLTGLSAARAAGRKVLLPYLTAGYPSMDATRALLQRCDTAGCAAVELGFPFSDSIADGPVIQESFNRALAAGFRVEQVFQAASAVRPGLQCGLLAMVSMSIVRRIGLADFVARAADSGFDGLIVPDVPVDEAAGLGEIVAARALCNVLMAAPTSSPARRAEIGRKSTGFVYLISARGITGERGSLPADLVANIAAMRAVTSVPVIVGFGIGTAAQVQAVCAHADGVIVGSALIRRVTAAVDEGRDAPAIVANIGAYLDELSTGLRPE